MTDINETEDSLPADALERLVNRVVTKFTQAEISTEEAASRLVGTGRFEENSDALEFLRGEICPKLEDRLHEVEEDVQRLQAEADRIRGILTQSARGPVFSATVGSPSTPQTLSAASAAVANASARSRKDKAEKEKSERKRKGASGESTEAVWGGHDETPAASDSASAGVDSALTSRAATADATANVSDRALPGVFANEESESTEPESQPGASSMTHDVDNHRESASDSLTRGASGEASL